ncbi:LacI family transcriptional regulator [Paenibacillus sambharensis]|uniref:LacI family transcriptional regulator n=1 Tax=Paenibacillus sambharensis TaxID=1803190 RepID=A0A2W1LQB2_9BACL|nr:ABC transporter substrate-binding protein [Paenibacillus sambharensis]PZD94011.1 LacI family transcriptional regulator [Paenibacillus sambharensis]
MKNVLVGLFAVIVLLALPSCLTSDMEQQLPPNEVLAPSAPGFDEWVSTHARSSEAPITLGFSQLGSESAWRMANTASIEEAAVESGITLMMKNAEQSQEKQFEVIRSFIEMNVDVIAIAPVVETGWDEILEEAAQAGIPVIIVDRSVDVRDPSLFVTTIGSDFYEEGVKAGKYLLDKVSNRPGPIRVVELQGTVGSTPSIQRGQGFLDTISSRSDITVTYSAFADFTEAKGKAMMQQILKQSPGEPPHVLYAHNDDMALGAIEAIEEAGLAPGTDIIVISVDGTRRALEKLAAGKLNAVVECNPLLGPQVMQATKEIMAGRTLPKRMVPKEDIFTQERAKEELHNRKF